MNLKITLRNLLITVLVIAVVFTAVEVCLTHAQGPDEVSDTYEMQDMENGEILMMTFERTPYENFASSTVFASLLNDAVKDGDIVADPLFPEAYDGYPLLADMDDEELYDENTVNIVVIGDSFVWGFYSINRNEVFWRQLETHLRAQGYNVRVRAVCMGGANAYEELSWLKDSTLVADLDPDLVLFGYIDNDPDDRVSEDDPNANDIVLDPYEDVPLLSSLSRILPTTTSRLANYILARTMYTAEGNHIKSASFPPILKGEVYEKYENRFVKPLSEFASQVDFPVALMTLPPYPSKLIQSALYKPLHTLYKQYPNIGFYDCLDEFCDHFAAKKHEPNYSVNEADFHPGSATHWFYADYIEKFLKKDYKDVLGEKTDADLNRDYIRINEYLPVGVNPTLLQKTKEESVYQITYPSLKKSKAGEYRALGAPFEYYFLTLPLQEAHIKLAFENPADLSQVSITGDGVNSVSLYYTRIDEALGYDDHTVRPFGEANADGTVWTDATADQVNALLIHINYADNDGGTFTLTLTRNENGGDKQ